MNGHVYVYAMTKRTQTTGLDKIFQRKIVTVSYSYLLACVLGAQKNRLNETVLLSTHNICFG